MIDFDHDFVAMPSHSWNSPIQQNTHIVYTHTHSNNLPGENVLFQFHLTNPALISCVNNMEYEAWSLSKSEIYFNFLLSYLCWDVPSAPSHTLLRAWLKGFFNMFHMHLKWVWGCTYWNMLMQTKIWVLTCMCEATWLTASSSHSEPRFSSRSTTILGWKCQFYICVLQWTKPLSMSLFI